MAVSGAGMSKKELRELQARLAYEQSQKELELKSLSELASELNKTWPDLAKAFNSIANSASLTGSRLDDARREAKKLYSNLTQVGSATFDMSANISTILLHLRELEAEQNDLYDISRRNAKLEQDKLDIFNQQRDAAKDLSDIEVKRGEAAVKLLLLQKTTLGKKASKADRDALQKDTTDAANELSHLQQQEKQARDTLDDINNRKRGIDMRPPEIQRTDVSAIAEEVAALRSLETQYNQLQKAHIAAIDKGINPERIADAMLAPFKAVNDFISAIPGGSFVSKIFGLDDKLEDANEAMIKRMTQSIQAGGGRMSAVFTGLGAGVKSFIASMGPIGIALAAIAVIAWGINKALDVDKETTKMAQDLDVSKTEAIKLKENLSEAAKHLEQTGINSSVLAENMGEIRNHMGMNVGAIAETNDNAKQLVITTAVLNKRLGLSAEEIMGLNSASAAFGGTLEQTVAVTNVFADKLVTSRILLKDIGSLSKTIQINFSKMLPKLAEAVHKSKLFGISLNEVSAAGDKLLSIESSLESEMKMNILTGRSINMNHARLYKLMGREDLMLDDIVSKMGSYADYQDMIPLQRQALAEGMGFEMDMLDKMMLKREELKNLGISEVELERLHALKGQDRWKELERIKHTSNKTLATELERKFVADDRITQAEKLSNIVDKLMDKLMVIFIPVLEKIVWLLEGATSLFDKKIADSQSIGDVAWNAAKNQMFGTAGAATLTAMSVQSQANQMIKDSGIAQNARGGVIDQSGISLVGEEGPEIVHLPKSASVTPHKESASLLGRLSKSDNYRNDQQVVSNNTSMPEVVSLLKQLIATVDQPSVIQIGNRTIEEIDRLHNMRRTYNTKLDQSYGING